MLETLMREWKAGSTYVDSFVTRYINEHECMVMTNSDLSGVADEIIEREILVHQTLGRSFEWKLFSCDLPSDLLDRLIARGFEIGIKEVVCAMDITMQMPSANPDNRVERVRSDEQLKDFRWVAEEVFGKDYSYTTGELAKCIANGTEDQVGFVAYDGSTPVSIGRIYLADGSACAGLYTGGTLSEYRGRGFYQAVVAARALYAKEKGASIIWVDARPTSRRILERLGFEALVETWPSEWTYSQVKQV